MNNLSETFGCKVFNESVMRQRLPKETYKMLRRTIEDGKDLDPVVAGVVANAMKDWAVENGCTHYTHWFQPMTGITAEKHDSFISPAAEGHIIMEFSGKELIKGEPDASSFPSGGLRATFEARGYTAWDPTSYAFIRDDVLCIPTAFCSFGGEALDKKTPLLRSMEALSAQTVRILRLFGNNDVKRATPAVGAEQEYFLVDTDVFSRRRDLLYTGRTLFGARPPKGQELDDHYFGSIKQRISIFMKEVDEELWKLGVLSKTRHNEAAPAQHEVAPIFTSANIAADHNQLVMDVLKKVAERNHMVCLLHEKPFAGINGSGKHNNWSMMTNTGDNLLNPGKTPHSNIQFLLFLCAVIKAVDEHQDLLRTAVSSAGNDHRLGGGEAPPAIISVFLGDEMTAILDSIENRSEYDIRTKSHLESGVHVLPSFATDTTDRNRTSPFAFTGNRFEFRMLGSNFSISDPNVVINTIVADTLRIFAEELENIPAEDFEDAVFSLLQRTIAEHKRIIFNGNNYSDEWKEEAARRGLLNLPTTADAVPYLVTEENIALFGRMGVFSATELHSRYEVMLENYCKVIRIEALTMMEMARKQILPAVFAYTDKLTKTACRKKDLDIPFAAEREFVKKLSSLADELFSKTDTLDEVLAGDNGIEDPLSRALYYKDSVLTAMANMRTTADELETLTAEDLWPFPTYGDLLFSIR